MLNEHLPEEEKQLFEAIVKNDVVLLKTLLTKHKNVDIFDDNSMTPLQHACYKGNKEIVQMLLDQGADVNLCKHEHGYTALHFAGLSGNVDVCNLLLLAGANTQAINTVGRTAAQMAAFVGHHSCVAIINNFIPKSVIDYYTQIHEPRDKPLLPPIIANSFHAFVMQINIHPIRVAMSIKNLAGLSEHLNDIEKVLESMRLKEMRGGIENNEVMAFKLHYLLFIVKNIKKLKEIHAETKDETKDTEKKFDFVEVLAKKLLKCNKNGDMENLDAFLKDCIREFPHKESTIIRQMVATLADVNAPPAFGIINAAINGQRGFIDNIPLCSACGEESPSKKCSRCKSVQYCDKICQRLHWSAHKKYCNLEKNSQTDKPDVDASELSSQLNNLLCDK